MSQITLTIPDEIALPLKLVTDELASELRIAAAVKLYELGWLAQSAGKIS